MDLGWPEILLILAIILIVFGVGKLPQVASQMGKGIREFRKAQRGDYDDDKEKKGPAEVDANQSKLLAQGTVEAGAKTSEQSMQDELAATKARLEATEAKLRELQESAGNR